MHMADALIIPAVGGTMYLCSAITANQSIKKMQLKQDYKKVPLMGVMGAFVFAVQMVNFTIPGTGSSGHLCGSMLLSAILGPYAGFLTMIGILMVQALLFADGGILALGCNIWNMAFYGCFVGGFLIWETFVKTKISRKRIMAAAIIGSILSTQLGALSVVLETTVSGVTELPFISFLAVMQPIHLMIGLVEGLITGTVLLFLYEANPEMLWGVGKTALKEGRWSVSGKKIILVLVLAAVLTGTVFSVGASEYPDGLEWSIERTSKSEDYGIVTQVHEVSQQTQSITSILPDYGFQTQESDYGTSLSGLIGVVILLALGTGIGYLIRKTRKKETYES